MSFSGCSYLSQPIITDTETAINSIKDIVEDMDMRYNLFAQEGYENLAQRHNDNKTDIPYHVVIFDEFADVILTGDRKQKKEFEELVSRIAGKGRAAGIHLVLATQRPDRNVVTGLIKANLLLTICLRVKTGINSKVVIDKVGAEKLLGKGDLFCDWGLGIERAQSLYITQEEIQGILGKPKSMHQNPVQKQTTAIEKEDLVFNMLSAIPEHSDKGIHYQIYGNELRFNAKEIYGILRSHSRISELVHISEQDFKENIKQFQTGNPKTQKIGKTTKYAHSLDISKMELKGIKLTA